MAKGHSGLDAFPTLNKGKPSSGLLVGKHLVFVWTLILVLFTSAQATSTPDWPAIEKAIREHRYAWAEQELENYLRSEPRDFRAHMLMGIVLDENNEPAKAEQHLLEAVKLRPDAPAAHLNLGKHYAREGELAAALSEFESALRLDPNDPTAHNNLGLILIARGKTVDALGEFRKAVTLAPGEPGARLNLFKAQLALKEFQEARNTARKLVEMAPASADLLSRLGREQAVAGDYAGAIDNLKGAAALDPDSYPVRYNLGLAYYRGGDLAQARDTLESLRKERETAEVDNLLGEIYEGNKEYLSAVKAFQNAAELEPKNEDYRFDYIFELLVHHNFDAAILVGEPAVREFPNSWRMAIALGVAYFGRGRFTESVRDFYGTAERFPDAELPLYVLALAAEATAEQIDATLPLVTAYQQRHPGAFWPYYFLGKMTYQQGLKNGQGEDFERALKLLTTSLQKNPDYAESHYELGNVYSKLERWKDAIQEYEDAIKLKPDLSEAHYRLSQAYRRTGNLTKADQELQIHQKLKQREAQEGLRLRQVQVFLYQLRK
jgi:tetratricopeptide (TPR) repeat protein